MKSQAHSVLKCFATFPLIFLNKKENILTVTQYNICWGPNIAELSLDCQLLDNDTETLLNLKA